MLMRALTPLAIAVQARVPVLRQQAKALETLEAMAAQGLISALFEEASATDSVAPDEARWFRAETGAPPRSREAVIIRPAEDRNGVAERRR